MRDLRVKIGVLHIHSQVWRHKPRHLPKEGKWPSFYTIPWKGGDLQSHLLECYAFGSIFNAMLRNRNWTYVEVTTIWGQTIKILVLMHVRDLVQRTKLLKHTTHKNKVGWTYLSQAHVDSSDTRSLMNQLAFDIWEVIGQRRFGEEGDEDEEEGEIET